MSVLVFLDRSRGQMTNQDHYFATVAGVAFSAVSYNDFCRRYFRLKKRFFRRGEVGARALRGKVLLSRRGMESPRRVEFMGELFSLCRLLKATAFSATRAYTAQEKAPSGEAPLGTSQSALGLEDYCCRDACPVLLAYVIERVNSFMLETHPGQAASLVFKSEAGEGINQISSAVMNLFFQTPYGAGFQGLSGTPLFAPAAYSPGLQTANLFAYIINQHYSGRIQLKEFFEEVETLQYVSAIQRDEFELKGMNLID